MSERRVDVAVVGAGIVGLATARALLQRAPRSLLVLEAEAEVAVHQTGHNSGVIHSGLYYRPGSLKAKTCVAGRRELLEFCREQGVAHEICGKVVVATREEELPALEELERRGRANGLEGIQRLDPAGIREHEPHCIGIAGLRVPQTGIVDFQGVAAALARDVESRGGEVRKSTRFLGLVRDGSDLVLTTSGGEIRAGGLVNCAGLQSDRVARRSGAAPDIRILPFRGEYYELRPERASLVRNLVYPVPDPRFPFLGVHFTRMVGGGVEAGPNAVFAFKREGYRKRDFSFSDTAAALAWPGLYPLAVRYWKTAAAEMVRSYSKGAFVRALQRLIPELCPEDVQPGGSGVRAQAVDRRGRLLDDFHLVEGPRAVHVLNAPSPAATACLAVGEAVAERVEQVLA